MKRFGMYRTDLRFSILKNNKMFVFSCRTDGMSTTKYADEFVPLTFEMIPEVQQLGRTVRHQNLSVMGAPN
jgi:hypothetical protein